MIVAAVLSTPVIIMAMIPALQFNHWGFVSLALALPVVLWSGWPFTVPPSRTFAELLAGRYVENTLSNKPRPLCAILPLLAHNVFLFCVTVLKDRNTLRITPLEVHPGSKAMEATVNRWGRRDGRAHEPSSAPIARAAFQHVALHLDPVGHDVVDAGVQARGR